MRDGRKDDVEEESWTEMEDVQPDVVEAVPIRHGMVLGGRYAIERIIGRGGSGVVVRAHDRDLKAAVAIKIVRAELAGQRMWAERLAREVRLARQIQHPHVLRVFDFEQADGRAFLVMELAERGTVRDEIRAGAMAARPLAERIADARAVASALDAIHRAGIVHRDLSLQNLLRLRDGRLVLSDFGLAVDTSDSTSSVHGGTVAYMAPEVLRGDKATFASDIWGLGIVIHEIVFGVKPRWSAAANATMLEPELGRKPTAEERAVLAACRACTAKDPARRIASAAEVGRLLAEPHRWWRARWRLALSARRPIVYASALTLLAAVAIGLVEARHRVRETQTPTMTAEGTAQSPLIVPTGEPADWTDVSTTMVEVPDRIACTRLLPDQRTIRFVWGTPPRAEDFDIVTRKRVPSPLVPAAYAEGCPDLSPDGKRLVYQSHTADGRPFAFLSDRPDGRDAIPVIPTADPTMSSEPTWLPDGESISYDVDTIHVGVFSTASHKVTIVPEVTPRRYITLFRSPASDGVLIFGNFENGYTEVTHVTLPRLEQRERFQIAEPALDIRLRGQRLYYIGRSVPMQAPLVEVDLVARRARPRGFIRKQVMRYPLTTNDGLWFVSIHHGSKLSVRANDGSVIDIADTDGIGHASHCGRDLIVDRAEADGHIAVERIDHSGKRLRRFGDGPVDYFPTCTPDGQTWFFVRRGTVQDLVRCTEQGCRSFVNGVAGGLAVSPDGKRLAFTIFAVHRPVIKWISVDGGAVHDVIETDAWCAAGWASNNTLWVSVRRGRNVVWTEVDADSGKETGHVLPGTGDCSDGEGDPGSPVNPDLRVVARRVSQLRFLGKRQLDGP